MTIPLAKEHVDTTLDFCEVVVFWGRNHPRKHVSPMTGRKIFWMGNKSVMKLSQLTDLLVDAILSSLVSSCLS